MREIPIRLTDGNRVDAVINGVCVATDQDGSLPAPFDLFLASIGTCSGFYVARFCQQRGIPVDGIEIVQRYDVDRETHLVPGIEIAVKLPPTFPERYRDAVLRAIGQCAVKRHLEQPPRIDVRIVDGEESASRP